MPGWSPEIANELIAMAAADGGAFDQLQLQGLVYIAHGWCLAITGQPLTGDRPEAWDFGPAYRRMLDRFAPFGTRLVIGVTNPSRVSPAGQNKLHLEGDHFILDAIETDILRRVYKCFGSFNSIDLAAITRRGSSPWKAVFDEGRGRYRDIPHSLVRAQFVQLAEHSAAAP